MYGVLSITGFLACIHVKELSPAILCVQGKMELCADLGLNNVCQM
jgi:hypothetical protein